MTGLSVLRQRWPLDLPDGLLDSTSHLVEEKQQDSVHSASL